MSHLKMKLLWFILGVSWGLWTVTLSEITASTESTLTTEDFIESTTTSMDATVIETLITSTNGLTITEPTYVEEPVSYASINSSIVSARHIELNRTLEESFLKNVYRDCTRKPSFSCVSNNVYSYFENTLGSEEFEVSDGFSFLKNKNDYNATVGHSKRSTSSFFGKTVSDIGDALYDKGVKFLMTHDLNFQLPELFFGGATVKLSPKSIEDDGALIKLELPKPDGRFFLKRIQDYLNDESEGGVDISDKDDPSAPSGKLFKKKLLLSFLAILLVIKFIKVKLLFLLPLILGIGTVKKLLLKFLFFVFPFLAHLYKQCYHKHHHTVTYHNVGGGGGGHHSPPIDYGYGPPPDALFSSHGGPPDYYRRTDYVANNNVQGGNAWPVANNQQQGTSWDASSLFDAAQLAYRGYFLGDEQRVSRSAHPVTESIIGQEYKQQIQQHQMQFTPNQMFQQQQEIQAQQYNHQQQQQYQQQQQHYQQFQQLHQQGLQHHKHPELQLIHQPGAVQFVQNPDNHLHPMQTSNGIGGHQMLPVAQPLASPLSPIISPSDEAVVRAQLNFQQQILTPKPATAGTTVPVTYDPFYSPILQRMDNVFVQLGFNEEACRERLVCSMYKNPSKYSPHSNLISAELSRDSRELQKPTTTNSAVVRFYKYVQAAKDGQNKKNCLRLYPSCTVNTEV